MMSWDFPNNSQDIKHSLHFQSTGFNLIKPNTVCMRKRQAQFKITSLFVILNCAD